MMKEAMIRVRKEAKGTGIVILNAVHDEKVVVTILNAGKPLEHLTPQRS